MDEWVVYQRQGMDAGLICGIVGNGLEDVGPGMHADCRWMGCEMEGR